jgi:Ca-activated chloride channel family protein
MRKIFMLSLLSTMLMSAQDLQAQTPASVANKPSATDDDVVRVDTNLVTVLASVVDRTGRYVSNLSKGDFRIYEDGVEQEIAYFAPVEQPFTIAFLIDVSGSARFRIEEIRDAANVFLSRLRPNDRLLVVSFDGAINVVTETASVLEIRSETLLLKSVSNGTRLYDTIDFVLKERFNKIPGRKAIVLFTDGIDNHSRVAYTQSLRDIDETDVLIYPIQFDTYAGLRERVLQAKKECERRGWMGCEARLTHPAGEELKRADSYLKGLAQKTGTRVYLPNDPSNLAQAFTSITEDLSKQYSLGYYPSAHLRAGQRRQIKVRVPSPDLIVRARGDYVVGATMTKRPR